jgi:hypothetical protein
MALNTPIATVAAITGQAFARNSEGKLRELKVGDVLLEGEGLVTSEGSSVELEMADGANLSFTQPVDMTLTPDLLSGRAAGADEAALDRATPEQLANALEEGRLEDEGNSSNILANEGGDGHFFTLIARLIDDLDGLGVAGRGPEQALPATLDPGIDSEGNETIAFGTGVDTPVPFGPLQCDAVLH